MKNYSLSPRHDHFTELLPLRHTTVGRDVYITALAY